MVKFQANPRSAGGKWFIGACVNARVTKRSLSSWSNFLLLKSAPHRACTFSFLRLKKKKYIEKIKIPVRFNFSTNPSLYSLTSRCFSSLKKRAVSSFLHSIQLF
jgi:hypothetical protein